MKKTTLIATYNLAFGRAVAAELTLLDRASIIIVAGGDVTPERAAGDSTIAELPWRPSSFVSTRSAVLEAANATNAINDAIVLAAYPDPSQDPGTDERFADVDKVIDECAKGFIAMTREIAGHLAARGGGRLLLAYPNADEDTPRAPSQAAAAGAVSAFACAFARAADGAVEAVAVSDSGYQHDATARFLAKLLEKSLDRKTQRVVRFNGKSGPFGLF